MRDNVSACHIPSLIKLEELSSDGGINSGQDKCLNNDRNQEVQDTKSQVVLNARGKVKTIKAT